MLRITTNLHKYDQELCGTNSGVPTTMTSPWCYRINGGSCWAFFVVVILDHWMYYLLKMLASLELWAGSGQQWHINRPGVSLDRLSFSCVLWHWVYLSTIRKKDSLLGKHSCWRVGPWFSLAYVFLWLVVSSSHSTYFAGTFGCLLVPLMTYGKPMIFFMLFTGHRENALHNEVLNLILSEGTQSVFSPLQIIQSVTFRPSILTGSEGVSYVAIYIA